MVTGKQIHKRFGELEILKGVDVEIGAAEIVSIVGSSGAGKTTLLTILGTLDKPSSGQVFINGQEVSSFAERKLAAFRNKHIGFVFQFHQLLPEFTAVENVAMPALISGMNRRQALVHAEELLDLLALRDRREHKPSALSGGEQQRVAVARALVNKPNVVFADEPSGNLDSVNAEELHRLFFRLREELKQAFVIVTHNNDLARMADRMLTMRDGVIVQ